MSKVEKSNFFGSKKKNSEKTSHKMQSRQDSPGNDFFIFHAKQFLG